MHGRDTGCEVQVKRLSKQFGARLAVRELDLTLGRSEFVTIVGVSGSGKSTLLRLLCALETPTAGQIDISDERGARADQVRVVFQEPRLLPWRSVLDNVRVGLHDADSAQRAQDVLDKVGLRDRLHEYPGPLSGGQKQRVALARALFCDPALMLFDEPFGALDALTRMSAQRLVEDVWLERGFTALLVTHDVEEAVLLGDRVLVFDAGRVTHEVRVDLPRPRARDNPEVGRLTGVLLRAILTADDAAQASHARTSRHDATLVRPVQAPARG
jgi:sulfonate transport system ATP-binding protein